MNLSETHPKSIRNFKQGIELQPQICKAICYLFDEIRYELNGIEIDRCKNVGITSTIKDYISLTHGQSYIMKNAGWLDMK